MLEIPQGLDYAGVNHPHIRPRENQRLNQCLENIPYTRVLPPSNTKILNNLDHFVRDFLRLPTTTGQSLSEAAKTQLSYLEYDTEISGRPYARKYRSMLACISSSSSLQ